MIMPVYISEMSPATSHGILGSLIGPTFALGNLFASVFNIGFAEFSFGWRFSLSIQGILGILYMIGMGLLPHSPWCVLCPQ